MRRTLKFNLDLANTLKAQKIKNLSKEYQRVVNYYLEILSSQNKYILTKEEVKSCISELSYRFKQCAGRQATKIWKSWRRNKKKGKLPKLNGSMVLDNRFIKIEKAKATSFDYWLKLATLNKGNSILIPFKSYNYANNYFKDWEVVSGGRINIKDDKCFLLLTFEKDIPSKKMKGNNIVLILELRNL